MIRVVFVVGKLELVECRRGSGVSIAMRTTVVLLTVVLLLSVLLLVVGAVCVDVVVDCE